MVLTPVELRAIACITQDKVRIEYNGATFTEELKFDLLVAGCLLVELKALQEVHPVHKAQLLSYMSCQATAHGVCLLLSTRRSD